jgi:tRNA threonylcarbamoyladenosine biosynthesis protein TsaB
VNLLGLDTATSATAVGVLRDDGETWEALDEVAPGERPRHARRVLPLAAELLERAGLSFKDVDRLVVGIGPGTFTGLRIGIATARGLALSLGVEMIGIGTLRTLAAAVDGPALAVLDARRGEAFVAAYAGGTELLAPGVVALAALGDLGARLGRECLAVGEGAIRFRTNLEDAGVAVAPGGSSVHGVSAAVACRLVATGAPKASEPVTPMYLRLPDAEIALRQGTR